MQHIGDLIIQRIKNREPGWMLSAKDFIDLGSRQAIDTALHRLESRHVIRRIARGIYDCPRQSKLTGKAASPDIWIAAQTLGRKNGWKIQPSGETALNLLGLSTQVPGTFVFYTDGPSRKYEIDGKLLSFRRRAPKDLLSIPERAVLVIQALKALGKDRVDTSIINKLQAELSAKECRNLLAGTQYATGWVYDVIRRICSEK